MKDKITRFFSSQYNLTFFMLIIVFTFKYLPDVIQLFFMGIGVIFAIIMAFILKKRDKPIGQVILLLQLAIVLACVGLTSVFKSHYDVLFKLYGIKLLLVGLIVLLSTVITGITMAFKSESRRKIKQAMLAGILISVPVIACIILLSQNNF